MLGQKLFVAEIIELNGRRYQSEDIRRAILRGELKTINDVLELLEEKNEDLEKLIEHKENL